MKTMLRNVAIFGFVVALLNCAAYAQQQDPTTRPRRNFDPGQFQKMIEDRLKERLGATDEEWTAIQPRLEHVLTLQREAMMGGGMGMGMLFGRGPGGFQNQGEPSPVVKAAQDLQAAVDSNGGANEISAKMTAYREAQAKARNDLAEARKSLKELLTNKQEAVLLMTGILD